MAYKISKGLSYIITLYTITSLRLTNIDCANKLEANKCNSNSSFQFLSSFIFSESRNLLFFKISSDVIRGIVVSIAIKVLVGAHPDSYKN